ncbi:Enolase [Bienertia sinuspersici]
MQTYFCPRGLMKRSRDLGDILIDALIRDLKNVQDRSKIIVMDFDGSHAKGIARSLRKLGVKAKKVLTTLISCYLLMQQRPYVLQGVFKYWIKDGLRAELKPETAVTIPDEVAHA